MIAAAKLRAALMVGGMTAQVGDCARTLRRLAMVMIACLALGTAWAQTGVRCDRDLARSHGVSLPHARLTTVNESAVGEQRLCTSVYVVSGKNARRLEWQLVERFGMGRLVFQCCGWVPEGGRKGVFRRSHPLADGALASYSIEMHSGETSEQSWAKIERFYVVLAIDAI